MLSKHFNRGRTSRILFFLFFFMWCQNKHNMVLQYRKFEGKNKKKKRNWIFLIWKTDFSTLNLHNWKRWEKKIMMQRQTRADIFWGVVFHRFFLYVSWLFAFLSFTVLFLTFLYCQEIEFSPFSFYLLYLLLLLYDPLEQIYCYFIVLMTDLNSQSHCRFCRIYVDYIWPIPLVNVVWYICGTTFIIVLQHLMWCCFFHS